MATKLERAQQGLLSKCGLEEDRQSGSNTERESGRIMQLLSFHSQKVWGLTLTHTYTHIHKHTTDDLNFTPH